MEDVISEEIKKNILEEYNMKTFWNNLVVAFSLYSKIPMPNVELTEKNMKY